MADQTLPQLDAIIDNDSQDLYLVVRQGIAKKIARSVFTDGLLTVANNLADVGNPASALANIGGMTTTEIADYVATVLDAYHTSEQSRFLLAALFADAIALSFGDGIIVSGCEYDPATGDLTEGLVVIETATSSYELFYYPGGNVSSVFTHPNEYGYFVVDAAYNSSSVNAGEIKRVTVWDENDSISERRVGVNFSVRRQPSRYSDYLLYTTRKDFVPQKIMFGPDDINSRLVASQTSPPGALVYPNGRVDFFGVLEVPASSFLNIDEDIITLPVDVPTPSSSIYGTYLSPVNILSQTNGVTQDTIASFMSAVGRSVRFNHPFSLNSANRTLILPLAGISYQNESYV